ncbi:MAG: hypothetical protein EOO10_10050 [Chitinophagaceae bacterium]|nr:MAG: hypothetical protein EOO10_10050 [Chitinophagaceae bacterium]
MKTSIPKKVLLLMVLFCNVIAVFAQDKVTMLNGEKREGKVVSVSDNAVKFVYKGETLEYEFKKSEINKIDFSSGRTEVVNASAPVSASPSSTPAERKGKIAVLPFDFITNDASIDVTAISQQLQTETYNSIKENTSLKDVQDPITTNSLLAKAGLTRSNITTKTPQEMAILLGVENVVYGIANVTTKGSSTYGSGISTVDGKATEKKDRSKETTKVSGTVYNSNNSSTMVQYDTKIDLNFYTDQGKNIYSESRKAFGSGFDAHSATVNYLVKRCPFGSKAKH